MTNTWDDLPIEMMGERPQLAMTKERRNEADHETQSEAPHPRQGS